MTEDEIKPELGDLVEYGSAVRDKYGNVIVPASKGIVKKAHKDGSIIVRPESGAKDHKLWPLEFFVLSKDYA